MSHVSFGTYQDNGTPANSSGFNGFPAPTLTDVSGDPNLYPLAVDFATQINWFWKSKRWSLATDFTFSAGPDSASLDNGELDGGSVNSAAVLTTDELQLIFPGTGATGPGTSCTIPFTGTFTGGGGITTSFTLFINSDRQPAIYFDGTDLFPALDVTFNVSINPVDSTNWLNIIFSTRPLASQSGTVAATIDGIDLTLNYKILVQTGDATFTATQFDLTISEFWPYT